LSSIHIRIAMSHLLAAITS